MQKKKGTIALTALLLSAGLTACGSTEASVATTTEATTEAGTEAATEETAAASTEAETTTAAAAEEMTEEVTTESSTEESTEDTAAAEEAIDTTALTDGLTETNTKYTAGAYAGISFQSAVTAAGMLSWYVENDPSESLVEDTVAAWCSDNGIDTESFEEGLDTVYDAALSTLDDEGQDLLSTGGWNDPVTWDKDDVEDLFSAIYTGAGLTMPE